MEGFLVNFCISILAIACLLERGEGRREKHGNGGLNMRLNIPKYANVGDNVNMSCKYDLGTDGTLYTVKWYKGAGEFYRYTPKESPPIKTFGFPGPEVDVTQSDATTLVLRSVTLPMSGKYSCEVTTDTPDFTTDLRSELLQVVVFPSSKPQISEVKSRYSVGDVVDINCTAFRSRPAANLTWYINTTPAQLLVSSTLEREKERDHTETSRLGLRFQLQPTHFINSKVKLQCNATVFDKYQQSSEVIIYQADKPQLSSVVDNFSSSSQSTNSNNNNRLRASGLPRNNGVGIYSFNSITSVLNTGALFLSLMTVYLHHHYLSHLYLLGNSGCSTMTI